MAKDQITVVEDKPKSLIPAEMADMVMDDGEGLAIDFERSDVAQSFLKIAQAMSPEVDESESAHIDGLKIGDLFNNGTQNFWAGKDGVHAVVVHFQKGFTEWAPRSETVSLVKDYGPEEPAFLKDIEQVNGQWPLPNGNTIIESAVYVLMLIDPETGDYENAVLNLSGTQHKKARRWNRAIQNARAKHPTTGKVFQPAPFYYTYLLSTTKEENDKGKWFGLVVQQDKPLLECTNGPMLYEICRGERQILKSGEKKIATAVAEAVEPKQREPGEEDEGEDETPF